VVFSTSASRGEDAILQKDISIRMFDADVRFWVVFFPLLGFGTVHSFWNNSGTGIPSRRAGISLMHLDLLHEVYDDIPKPRQADGPVYGLIQQRIATLLERAPAGPPRQAKVSPADVFLFPTGMAAIYNLHRYLLQRYNSTSIQFGLAFVNTTHVLEDFGPGTKLLIEGTLRDIELLGEYLGDERKEGRKVQALWTEIPSNPLLITPDLGKLRSLADEYGFLLVVDDTIGSFCNIDLLGVADIVVTSLTKSFSGYADVMGGSVSLNPSSERYPELKQMFAESYSNDYFEEEAVVLERNSRDYLSRSATLNNNAARLVEYLNEKANDPKSCVCRIYYPTTQSSLLNYQDRMRRPTEEFTPGYGGLFSVELSTEERAIAFYDNLNVHKGPHFGAPMALACPYAMILYSKGLKNSRYCDLSMAQVRIGVGLDDIELLLADFKFALEAADAVEEVKWG
jgi:cystathionine gamma-synthase